MVGGCPMCGGEVDVPAASSFGRCAHCRAQVVASSSRVLRRYQVRAALGAEEAAGALRRWMRGNAPVRALPAEAELEPPALEWLPVWFARFRRADGRPATAERRADDARVLEVREGAVPAAGLVPVRDDGAGLPAPTVEVEAFVGALGDATIDELALVHVPFWRVAYRFRGVRYAAAVDAATGEVRPGRFPAKPEAPFELLTAATWLGYLACLGGWRLGLPLPRVATLGAAVSATSTALALLLAALL